MRQAIIRTVCECQADLVATLNEQHLVLEASAIHPTDRTLESAPAHSMHPDEPSFDIGWLCPFCGRNTLRSFSADALSWRKVKAEEPAGETEQALRAG